MSRAEPSSARTKANESERLTPSAHWQVGTQEAWQTVVKCLCVPLCLCVSGYIRICAFQPSPSESIFSHRQVGTPEAWVCDIMRHLPQDLLDAIRTAGWAVLVLSADRLRQAQLPPSPPPPSLHLSLSISSTCWGHWAVLVLSAHRTGAQVPGALFLSLSLSSLKSLTSCSPVSLLLSYSSPHRSSILMIVSPNSVIVTNTASYATSP
jgi:hypothetical protein